MIEKREVKVQNFFDGLLNSDNNNQAPQRDGNDSRQKRLANRLFGAATETVGDRMADRTDKLHKYANIAAKSDRPITENVLRIAGDALDILNPRNVREANRHREKTREIGNDINSTPQSSRRDNQSLNNSSRRQGPSGSNSNTRTTSNGNNSRTTSNGSNSRTTSNGSDRRPTSN